jgi:hypothetical protein
MADGRYITEEQDLARIVADLRKRVAALESGNRVGSTSIDKGVLRVRSGSFEVGTLPQVYFGQVAVDGNMTPGWIFKRADGTDVFVLQGSSLSDQFWRFFDNQGNEIISDDGFSNQGLARPYISIPFAQHSTTIPVDTTTSATFTGLLSARYRKQHPRVSIDVLARSSDGSTVGEVRLIRVSTGEAIGYPALVTAGSYGIVNVVGEVGGSHMDVMELELQARRTSGGGTIGVRVFGAYGVQS